MAFSFRGGDFDEIACGQTGGFGEDGPSDCNLVISCKRANHLDGRVVDWSEPSAQLNQRLRLNSLGKLAMLLHAPKHGPRLSSGGFWGDGGRAGRFRGDPLNNAVVSGSEVASIKYCQQ